MAQSWDEQSIRRIARSVLFTERSDRSRQVRGRKNWQPVPQAGGGIVLAKTPVSGIPKLSSETLQGVMCDQYILELDPTDETVAHRTQKTDNGSPVQKLIFNNAEFEDIAGETFIMAEREIESGLLVCIWEECMQSEPEE